MKEFILRLALIPGIGPRTIHYLLKKFEIPEDIFRIDSEVLSRKFGLDPKLSEQIRKAKFDRSFEIESEVMERSDIRYITCLCPEYPELLKQTPSPPPLLFYQGSLEVLSLFPLAFVGSRKISLYGEKSTRTLIDHLARLHSQVCIISGLALGIDSRAHEAALQNGLPTAAVLGSGLKRIYPKNNERLARRILENGGLLISEYSSATQPLASNFPMRNRIISGLSKAVIVVEAGEKSGALITARFALEQNREVYAVPGSIDMLNSFGTNRLIQKGEAKLLLNIQDIFDDFSFKVQKEDQLKIPDIQQKIDFDSQAGKTLESQMILQIIQSEEMSPDEISGRTGIPIHKLLSMLSELEIQGLIRCGDAGNYRAM